MKPLLTPAQRATRKQALADMLTDINQQVAALPRSLLRELSPIMRHAEAQASSRLRAMMEGEAGATFTAQAYRNAVVQLRKALEALEPVASGMRKGMKRALPEAGHLAVSHVKRELVEFSQHFEGSMRHIPLNVASIMSQTEKMMVPRFRSSVARYMENASMDFRAMKRELVSGFLQGESFGQMATRLQRFGGPRGRVALVGVAGEPGAVMETIAEGLFTRHRYWAERIVRTEVLRGYNAAADLGIEQAHELDPKIVRRWDAALDARVCAECRYLDGRTAEPGGEFMPGVRDAPLHPQCRCATVAWRDDWNDAGMSQRGSARDPGAPAGRAEQPIE